MTSSQMPGYALTVLHTYIEGMEAFAAQRAGAKTWRDLTKPYQIFDYALAFRRRALLAGFFELSEADLDELAALTFADEQHRQWRDQFLLLSRRQDDEFDLYGRPLPATLDELLSLIELAEPYGRQGNNGITKKFVWRRVSYFAKLSDEELSGDPPVGRDDRDSAACAAALAALHPQLGPERVWHLITADGRHCTLSTAAPGRIYRTAKAAYQLISAEQLQWAVLGEWLFGMADRHYRNLLISKEARRATLIDLAPCWRFQPFFLGWSLLENGKKYCHSWARELWGMHDPTLTFAGTIIAAAAAREQAVVAVLRGFPLPSMVEMNVRRRFHLLQQTGHNAIRLVDLEQKANI